MARINQGYQKKTTETIYKPLRGLTSRKPVLAEPDTLTECENFVFVYGDTLATRPPAISSFYIPNQGTGLTNMDFGLQFYTSSYGKNYFAFNRDKEILFIDEDSTGKRTDTLVRSSTTAVFESTNEKDAVVYKDTFYSVEGVSTIIKWTGASHAVSTFDLPKAATYGNPVSICSFLGRLFVVTDKNYLRYTAVDSDSVWEDRVLMGGTITATTTSVALTGTETTFTQVEGTGDVMIPGVGVNIVLTNGVSECNLTIAKITSTTQMTVTTYPTISGTDLTWYLQGIDYYEPIETGDNKTLRFVRPFGNSLAITRTSKKDGIKGGGLTVVTPMPQDNTQVLAMNQRNITQTLNLFPYSLCEYQDNLVFLTDTGLYSVPSGNEFSKDAVKLTHLSKDKIEHLTKLLDITYQRKIRIHKVNNDKYDVLLISTVRTGEVGEPKRFLAAYMTPNGFEFTELTYNFEVQNGSNVTSCHGFGVMDSSVRLVSDRSILKTFTDSTKPVDTILSDSLTLTCDATDITCDSSARLCDHGEKISGTPKTIYKHLRTGLTSSNNLDWVRIQKMYVFTAESAYVPNVDTYSMYPYTIGSQIDTTGTTDGKNILSLSKKYEFVLQSTTAITSDSEVTTVDSDTVTIDSDSVVISPIVKQNSYYVNCRSLPNIGLSLTDDSSQGYLEIYGYGFSGLQTKFV